MTKAKYLRLKCPNCGTRAMVPDARADSPILCPGCEQTAVFVASRKKRKRKADSPAGLVVRRLLSTAVDFVLHRAVPVLLAVLLHDNHSFVVFAGLVVFGVFWIVWQRANGQTPGMWLAQLHTTVIREGLDKTAVILVRFAAGWLPFLVTCSLLVVVKEGGSETVQMLWGSMVLLGGFQNEMRHPAESLNWRLIFSRLTGA